MSRRRARSSLLTAAGICAWNARSWATTSCWPRRSRTPISSVSWSRARSRRFSQLRSWTWSVSAVASHSRSPRSRAMNSPSAVARAAPAMSLVWNSRPARVSRARIRAGASPLSVAASTWIAVASSASSMRPVSASTPARSPAAVCTSPGRPASRASASASRQVAQRLVGAAEMALHDAAVLVQRDAQLHRAAAGQRPVELVERRERARPGRRRRAGPRRGWRARAGRLPFGSSRRSASTAARRSSSTTAAPPNWATIGVTIDVARVSGVAANGAYAVAARNDDVSSRRAQRRASRFASRVVRRLDERRIDEQRAELLGVAGGEQLPRQLLDRARRARIAGEQGREPPVHRRRVGQVAPLRAPPAPGRTTAAAGHRSRRSGCPLASCSCDSGRRAPSPSRSSSSASVRPVREAASGPSTAPTRPGQSSS